MLDYRKLLKAEELGIAVPGLDSYLPPPDSFYHRDLGCSYLKESLPKSVREVVKLPVCSDCSNHILNLTLGTLNYRLLLVLIRLKTWLRKDEEAPLAASGRYQAIKLLQAELNERKERHASACEELGFAEAEEELDRRYQEIVKDLKIERDLTLKVIALETLELNSKRLEVHEGLAKSTLKVLFKEWAKKISKSKSQEDILSGLTRTVAFHEGYPQEEAEACVKEVLPEWEGMLKEIQSSPDVIVGVTSNLFNPSVDRKEKMILGISTMHVENLEKQILTMPAYAARWLHSATQGITRNSSPGSRYGQEAYCEVVAFTGNLPEGALEIACVLWEPRNRESEMFYFRKAVMAGLSL